MLLTMIRVPRTTERAVEKWEDAAEAGFQTLPDILLRKQVELGLSPTDMLVLINITMQTGVGLACLEG